MPTLHATNLLQSLTEQVTAIRTRTLSLASLPYAMLTEKPEPNRWNVLEVLYHLETYNTYYLPRMEAAIAANKKRATSDSFTPGWLGEYFTRAMLPGNNGTVANPMKAMKGHIPHAGYADTGIIELFGASEKRLINLLQSAIGQPIGTIRIGISIAPIITIRLGDCFRFLIAHQHRHLLQIERTLARVEHVRNEADVHA